MNAIRLPSTRARLRAIAVVDPQAVDYAALIRSAPRSKVRWELVATGGDALRLARMATMDLWLINAVLPDMSGPDLCAMIRSQCRKAVIFMVTDQYRAEDERAARICGAALFGCKPVQAQWFHHWFDARGTRTKQGTI